MRSTISGVVLQSWSRQSLYLAQGWSRQSTAQQRPGGTDGEMCGMLTQGHAHGTAGHRPFLRPRAVPSFLILLATGAPTSRPVFGPPFAVLNLKSSDDI